MKVCKHCSEKFDVTALDKEFLERVSPGVAGQKYLISEPTLCFDCRQQRRLIWRNERYMYKRKCDFSGKEIVSMYPPDSPFKIYDQSIWWSDKWDATAYGRDFDFSRPFFEQFRELQLAVPRLALVNKQSENAEYTNHSARNKNCYLSSVIFGCEDIYYTDWAIDHCINCMDCSYLLEGCELCYEVYYAWGSYKACFCEFIKRCQDVWFCYDCINCQNCFLCWNLRNKQYCIRNKQYSKKAYEAEMSKIFPLSYSELKKYRDEYIQTKKQKVIHPATYSIQTLNSTGDLLFYSKNCSFCFDSINMEDCRYCVDAIDVKDSLDIYHAGWAELMYECHAIDHGYNCLFCHFSYDNKNSIYCDCTQNSNDLFGCAGLNQKKYCILNKQYSREEYEKLIPRIIEHMRRTGEWGEFFPMDFSPFAYNQSRAPEYYPLTKDEALAKNIRWSDYHAPLPKTDKILDSSQLPEYISDVADDILKTGIFCEITKRPFLIIKQELDFYRKMGLPAPRRHPDQRYADRIAQRPLRKLFDSICQKCGIKIQTTFPPHSSEIVYCQNCYLEALH